MLNQSCNWPSCVVITLALSLVPALPSFSDDQIKSEVPATLPATVSEQETSKPKSEVEQVKGDHPSTAQELPYNAPDPNTPQVKPAYPSASPSIDFPATYKGRTDELLSDFRISRIGAKGAVQVSQLADETQLKISAILVEQNQQIINQNEQIIALLTKLAAKK